MLKNRLHFGINTLKTEMYAD